MAPNPYRADIDGLRAVAVLAVVLNHLSPALVPGGFVGVDVFFVISGFLITRIIGREIEEGRFSFARFYERRARRIFPALFAVLAGTLAAGYWLLLPSDYLQALRAALATLGFASNLLLWYQQSSYFDATESKLDPLLHTWSLAVEEQFYLLFPIFLLLCHRLWHRRVVRVLLLCALVSLAGAELVVRSNRTAVYFLSPFRAWELLVGALLAYGALPAIGSRLLRNTLSAGGLAAILLACWGYSDATVFPGLTALAPVLGAALVIHAGSSGPTWAGRLLQWRPLVYVGLISYSLYLWHWPLIVLAQYASGMEPPTPFAMAGLLAASMLLASLSYHFVEQPLRRGPGGLRRRALVPGAALALATGLFCGIGVALGGFPGRFSPAVVALDQARAPVIPYDRCSDLAPQAACLLGAGTGRPQMLLWGDSHLVSYAPALHELLGRRGVQALLLAYPGCAPVFGAASSIGADCREAQARVKAHLLAHPEITTVVMAGYWGNYFRADGPLRTASPAGGALTGQAAAEAGLRATLQWLAQHQRAVVLIGPLPAYGKSVPAALALEAATGHRFARSTADQQRLAGAAFTAVAGEFEGGALFRLVDPLPWLCAPQCALIRHGVSLYRDAHHLSVAGAMALTDELDAALDQAARVPEGLALPASLEASASRASEEK
ncbi:MAG: acyltransferase [Polaromonas sp.]|nr:acyltransferase [Polaromonas sp.]